MATKNNNIPETSNEYGFVFKKMNYILMCVGLIVLFVGYILMCGGGSDDPNEFNSAMFDSQRLYVAPILITTGFVIEIVAIMYKGKDNSTKDSDKSSVK